MKSLALNILDIVQNSIRAEASDIRIEVSESALSDSLSISVTDNGKGIPTGLVDRVTDPFVTTRTTRRTGLGLPLLKQHSEMAGGNLTIASGPGQGTRVSASFRLGHPDRQPLGDLCGVIKILLASNPSIDFTFCHSTDSGSYCFSTAEVKSELGIDIISGNGLINDISGMIMENLLIINASDMGYKDKYQEYKIK
jgi:hypothetical protein